MKNSRSGFTLIEILVATAVLALMLTVIAGLVNSASTSTKTSARRLDSTADARLVFDRLANDLSSIVWDGDTTLIVGSNNSPANNDTLAFINRSRPMSVGGNPARLQSLFYAVLADNDAAPELVRGFREVGWADTLSERLLGIDNQILNPVSADSTQIPVRSGVVRMAVALHVEPNDPTDPTIIPVFGTGVADYALESFSGGALPSGSTALDLSKVHAVTVALAVIDDASRVLAAGDLAAVANALPPPGPGQLPLEAWNADTPAIEKAAAATSAANAAAVRQNLRFHQRTFPINAQ